MLRAHWQALLSVAPAALGLLRERRLLMNPPVWQCRDCGYEWQAFSAEMTPCCRHDNYRCLSDLTQCDVPGCEKYFDPDEDGTPGNEDGQAICQACLDKAWKENG